MKVLAKFNKQRYFDLPGQSAYQLVAEVMSRIKFSDQNRSGASWLFSRNGNLVQDRFEADFWIALKQVCEECVSGKLKKVKTTKVTSLRVATIDVQPEVNEDTITGATRLLEAIEKYSEQLGI